MISFPARPTALRFSQPTVPHLAISDGQSWARFRLRLPHAVLGGRHCDSGRSAAPSPPPSGAMRASALGMSGGFSCLWRNAAHPVIIVLPDAYRRLCCFLLPLTGQNGVPLPPDAIALDAVAQVWLTAWAVDVFTVYALSASASVDEPLSSRGKEYASPFLCRQLGLWDLPQRQRAMRLQASLPLPPLLHILDSLTVSNNFTGFTPQVNEANRN
ncbi:hypothetical protein CORC01_10055 [Colletotrichum orchidophilum]|uniref:Uncharacterized protein n=1 Tax=Colletotrichum orchidophilum TaxID=1209926 RepID=A0A1G4AZU1_9PEZI|nr:uncharacterized protein CORC01_10055 [Colletotrichum orchidophilum]OHE94654.1 hypothetical protein CORC01_10055 [Colletotrichum orchidophilum]